MISIGTEQHKLLNVKKDVPQSNPRFARILRGKPSSKNLTRFSFRKPIVAERVKFLLRGKHLPISLRRNRGF